MRFLPVGGPPPWPYSDSKVLREPGGRLEFMDVVQRLSRFHRDSVLLTGTHMLWYMWNHPETLTSSADGWIGNRITQAYAERIISLACIYCSTHDQQPMQEVDFRLLCWELYSCADENPFSPEAATELEARLQRLESTSPLKALDPRLTPHLLAAAFKARVISEQSVGRNWDRGSLVRSYLVAREFRELGLQGKAYEAIERKFFLMRLEEFYRAIWVLYVKANDGVTVEFPGPSGRVQKHQPGRILLDEPSPSEEEMLGGLGLEDGALRVAASRLSISRRACGAFRADLEAIEPLLRRYAPRADWLSRWPIVDLEIGGPCEHLLVPSPWRLIPAFSELVLFEFIEFLAQEGGLDGPATSIRGKAFENYLEKALKDVPEMHDIDDLARSSDAGKRPDFLWVGEEYGILVEAKFSFRPNSDRRLKDVSAAVTAWDRAAEPLQQAREFLKVWLPKLEPKLRAPRRWVLAIVTSEPLVEEALGFKSIAKAGNLLIDTGLEAITLVSPSELEDWAFNASADAFARRSIDVYAALDPYSLHQDLLLGRPNATSPRTPPHIDDAWAALFGQGPEAKS